MTDATSVQPLHPLKAEETVTLKHFLRRVDFHARLGMVSWAARPRDCRCLATLRQSDCQSVCVRCGQQYCYVEHVVCFFVFDVRSRTLHAYFVCFFVNTFYIKT